MVDLFGNPTQITTTNKRGSKRFIINPLLAIFGSYTKSPGARCKNCEHFIRYRSGKTWFKCALRKAGGPATDHRANWQACGKFVDILPRCVGCGAERLDDCTCPLKRRRATKLVKSDKVKLPVPPKR